MHEDREVATGDDRAPYQEIAENALAVTGVRWVSVQHYDPERQVLRLRALAPMEGRPFQRLLDAMQRIAPGWHPLDVETPIDVNPIHERAYGRAETVEEPLREVAEGILPGPVITAIQRISGVRRALVEPFVVDGALAGSMAFLAAETLDAATRRAAHAFVRQAALTIEKDRLATAVSQQMADLRRSGREFIEADERLRKELALHLHGKVQTGLLAAGFVLDRCESILPDDPELALELIGEVKDEIDRLREEDIREVSHLLHPSVIDIALTPALRSLAGRYVDRFKSEVVADDAVAALDQAGVNRIPAALRLTVYRLVEEALANASQHGRPDEVTISLSLDEGMLVARIADDGAGFDPSRAETGLGLGGIDYRVREAGGQWRLESAPGEGTRITAWFRLDEPPAT